MSTTSIETTPELSRASSIALAGSRRSPSTISSSSLAPASPLLDSASTVVTSVVAVSTVVTSVVAYIVADARTPIGKMGGALASLSAADLGAIRSDVTER